MSEKGSEADIEPARLNVREVPITVNREREANGALTTSPGEQT